MTAIERDPRTHFEQLFKTMGLGPFVKDLYYGPIDENLPYSFSESDDNGAWFIELETGKHTVKICLGLYAWQVEYNITNIIRPLMGFMLLQHINTY